MRTLVYDSKSEVSGMNSVIFSTDIIK